MKLIALGSTGDAIYLIMVHGGGGTAIIGLIGGLMSAGTSAINILGSLVIACDDDASHRLQVAFAIVPECSFIKIVKIVLDIVFTVQAFNNGSYTNVEQKYAGGIGLVASIGEVSIQIINDCVVLDLLSFFSLLDTQSLLEYVTRSLVVCSVTFLVE